VRVRVWVWVRVRVRDQAFRDPHDSSRWLVIHGEGEGEGEGEGDPHNPNRWLLHSLTRTIPWLSPHTHTHPTCTHSLTPPHRHPRSPRQWSHLPWATGHHRQRLALALRADLRPVPGVVRGRGRVLPRTRTPGVDRGGRGRAVQLRQSIHCGRVRAKGNPDANPNASLILTLTLMLTLTLALALPLPPPYPSGGQRLVLQTHGSAGARPPRVGGRGVCVGDMCAGWVGVEVVWCGGKYFEVTWPVWPSVCSFDGLLLFLVNTRLL